MKVNRIMSIFATIIISSLCLNGYSQELKDSLKIKQAQQQHIFYRRSLQVDSVKAQKVAQIQDDYKAGINALMADTALNKAGKQTKIKALMNSKNQQLRLILNPAQQAKIIPTTERERPLPAKSN